MSDGDPAILGLPSSDPGDEGWVEQLRLDDLERESAPVAPSTACPAVHKDHGSFSLQ